MNAERLVRSMSLMQLALITQCAPDRRVLWTPLERAALDEYDRRILERERAA